MTDHSYQCCECGFEDFKGGYESCPECGSSMENDDD